MTGLSGAKSCKATSSTHIKGITIKEPTMTSNASAVTPMKLEDAVASSLAECHSLNLSITSSSSGLSQENLNADEFSHG